MSFLYKFLCLSVKDEQKIDYVWFLTKIYIILSFIVDKELIFYFETQDFFKVTRRKKSPLRKKMSRVVL